MFFGHNNFWVAGVDLLIARYYLRGLSLDGASQAWEMSRLYAQELLAAQVTAGSTSTLNG